MLHHFLVQQSFRTNFRLAFLLVAGLVLEQPRLKRDPNL